MSDGSNSKQVRNRGWDLIVDLESRLPFRIRAIDPVYQRHRTKSLGGGAFDYWLVLSNRLGELRNLIAPGIVLIISRRYFTWVTAIVLVGVGDR